MKSPTHIVNSNLYRSEDTPTSWTVTEDDEQTLTIYEHHEFRRSDYLTAVVFLLVGIVIWLLTNVVFYEQIINLDGLMLDPKFEYSLVTFLISMFFGLFGFVLLGLRHLEIKLTRARGPISLTCDQDGNISLPQTGVDLPNHTIARLEVADIFRNLNSSRYTDGVIVEVNLFYELPDNSAKEKRFPILKRAPQDQGIELANRLSEKTNWPLKNRLLENANRPVKPKSDAKKKSPLTKKKLTWGTIFIGLLGGAVTVYGLINLKEGIDSGSWPSVTGKISKSWIKIRHNSGHRAKDSKVPRVQYEYKVHDKPYTSERIHIIEEGFFKYKNAKKISDRYPVGKKVRVYYNPQNPAKSVLVQGTQFDAFMVIFMGLIFLLPALIHLFKRFK